MTKFLSILLLSSFFLTNASFAKSEDKVKFRVFTPSAIKSLLGDFPTAGSAAEAADYKTLLAWQETRTTEQCDNAEAQSSANLKTIFATNNGPLTDKEASFLEKLYIIKYASIGANIFLAKSLYDRQRPYDANPEVKPCIELESSSAYPSGHAAMAFAFAGLLGDQYPEKKAAFFKAAEQAALNRVIGGVHHPSDIVAGKKLGLAIYDLLKND